MGSLTYDFSFDCLLNDPTEELAKQAIKAKISDGSNETQLVYGTDYTVALNSDGHGGIDENGNPVHNYNILNK